MMHIEGMAAAAAAGGAGGAAPAPAPASSAAASSDPCAGMAVLPCAPTVSRASAGSSNNSSSFSAFVQPVARARAAAAPISPSLPSVVKAAEQPQPQPQQQQQQQPQPQNNHRRRQAPAAAARMLRRAVTVPLVVVKEEDSGFDSADHPAARPLFRETWMRLETEHAAGPAEHPQAKPMPDGHVVCCRFAPSSPMATAVGVMQARHLALSSPAMPLTVVQQLEQDDSLPLQTRMQSAQVGKRPTQVMSAKDYALLAAKEQVSPPLVARVDGMACEELSFVCQELRALPDCLQPAGASSLLASLDVPVFAANAPQTMVLSRNARIKNTNSGPDFPAVHFNCGPGSLRWIVLKPTSQEKFVAHCLGNDCSPWSLAWWPTERDLQALGIEYVVREQQPFELLHFAPETLAWAQATNSCTVLMWVVISKTTADLRKCMRQFQESRRRGLPAWLPMIRVCYRLVEQAAFEPIQSADTLEFQVLVLNQVRALLVSEDRLQRELQAANIPVKQLPDGMTLASLRCHECHAELFNTIFVRTQQQQQQQQQRRVACVICARAQNIAEYTACRLYSVERMISVAEAAQANIDRYNAEGSSSSLSDEMASSSCSVPGSPASLRVPWTPDSPVSPASHSHARLSASAPLMSSSTAIATAGSFAGVVGAIPSTPSSLSASTAAAALNGLASPSTAPPRSPSVRSNGSGGSPRSPRTVTCKVCNKSFGQTGNLARHMLTHSRDKPYRCEICGKGFSQGSHVKTHMAVHTGERAYACHACDKTFSQLGHLRYHLRAHVTKGEIPEAASQAIPFYSCACCHSRFWVRGLIERHIAQDGCGAADLSFVLEGFDNLLT